MSRPAKKEIRILMVEDDPGDVDLAREALKTVGETAVELIVVEDGEEAIGYLLRQGRYSNAPAPHLILLDLNLPRKDGREVLQEIKNNDQLKSIPVVIMTTSTAVKDIEFAYQHAANCYITKPFEFVHYTRTFKAICEFWFNIATLPTTN